ncbi:MAG: hypothetical protein RBG13Loki_2560 [Promethearchaeota archaeon CR_4]|nr:MAG: hypothetical protein RBG13Loki_2560 [Candidatus Lokiarchaeota archaeon CR_4]
MVLPPIDDIYVGLTSTAIFALGLVMSISMFVAMRRSDSKLLPYQGLFALNMAMNYSGTTLCFWSIIITGNNLPNMLTIILVYTTGPIGLATAMYVGFSMIKPKVAKPMAIIFLLTGIVQWASIYFNVFGIPGSGVRWNAAYLYTQGVTNPYLLAGINMPTSWLVVPGTLIDTILLPWGISPTFPFGSPSFIWVIFALLAFAIILGGGFIYLAFRSSGDIKSRSIKYAIGILMYSVLIFYDTGVDPVGWAFALKIATTMAEATAFGTIYLFVLRAALFIGYIILYLAMKPPKPAAFYPAK